MSIWDFEVSLAQWLVVWGGASAWGGFFLLFIRNDLWRGFGVVSVIVGTLLALLAILLRRRARQWRTKADTNQWRVREAALLSNVLWGAIVIGIVGVVVGLLWALLLSAKDLTAQGYGWALVAQFGFVFLFNLLQTQRLPRQN